MEPANVYEGYGQLVAEVDRVVNSPYPTQLKKLHDIVCHKCSHADVSRWSLARPCQIGYLAQNVLEARQQWPYILDLITKLCGCVAIRDSMLKVEPILLFETVARAVDGGPDSWKYNAAAIAMLSSPLPDKVTLPAASQSLFLGICDHAAQHPSAQSLKPVYMLLKGGLGPLVGLLPSETLSKLQNYFLDILKTIRNSDDNCLSLYCLATMKCFITAATDHSPAGSFYETQDLLASTPSSGKWKPEAMQQYFTGKKANKTLQLVVLRVYYACRASSAETLDEISNSLTLSNELVGILPSEVREAYCRDNQMIVEKIQEKAMQEGIEPCIRLQAFTFLCKLCTPQNLSAAIADGMAYSLRQLSNLSARVHFDEPSMKSFASAVSTDSIANLVLSVSDFARNASASDLVGSSKAIVEVIENLHSPLVTQEAVATGVLTAIGSSIFRNSLLSLNATLGMDIVARDDLEAGVCAVALLSARQQVVQNLCDLALRAALLANYTETEITSELFPILLRAHRLSAATHTDCKHACNPKRRALQEVLERDDNPPPQFVGDWREGLNVHLHRKADSEHDSLVQMFAAACHDLERRCETVEQPLNEEKERSAALRAQLDELNDELAAVEEEKSAQLIRAETLEAEKRSHIEELESAEAENDNLLDRVSELENRLRNTQNDAAEQLATLRKEREMAELRNASIVARKEEEQEEAQARLVGAEERLEIEKAHSSTLEHDLSQQRTDFAGLRSEMDTLCQANDELNATLSTSKAAKQDISQRYASLEAAEREATNRNALLGSELDALKHEMNALRASHAEEAERRSYQAGLELQETVRLHQNEREKLEADHRGLAQRLQQLTTDKQNESHRSAEEYTAQLAKRDRKLAESAKKISELKALCTEKDEQIAQANSMRSNLMAAMGIAGGTQKSHRRSTRLQSQYTAQEDDTNDSLELSVMAASFANVVGATGTSARVPETSANASQDDPSPKRPRPRKSIRIASPARGSTLGRVSRNSVYGKSTGKRQPLSAIAGNTNLSPAKDTARTPYPKDVKGGDGGFDESAFDGSELFASTPGLSLRQARNSVLPQDESDMV